MVPFFITGLPRTRSAWLANLFTTERTICFHEPAQLLAELIRKSPDQRVGIAGSNLVFAHTRLSATYPDAPWLYVERDPGEAMRSFIRFTRDHFRLLGRDVRRVWELHAVSAHVVQRGLRTLTITFEQLNDPAVIRQIWAHLVPELPFNPGRLAVLEDLQVDQRLVNRLGDLPHLLRTQP